MVLGQRHRRYIAAVSLVLILGAAIGVAWASIVSHESFRPSISVVLSAALAGVGIAACIPWWRALDEMQREAQLTSWYWGGCFGCLLGVIGAGLIGGVRSTLLSGALLVAAAQILCFAVCWVVYRLIHRHPAS